MDFGYDEHGNRLEPDDSSSGSSSYDGSGQEVASVSDDNAWQREGGGSSDEDDDDGSLQQQRRRRRRHRGSSTDAETSDSSSDFSNDVELVIGEAATQSLAEPLVEGKDVVSRPRATGAQGKFLVEDRRVAPLLIQDVHAAPSSERGFLDLLRGIPARQRNVALIGHLHHGKTSLLTMLLGGRAYRQREDEVERKISVKSSVVTEIVSGAHFQQASHLVSFCDTPGHPDFAAETAAALRLADAAMFCVDAVESVTRNAVRLLRQAVLQEGLPVILVITKVDRLIMDLKLPPMDAYRKLRMVVDAVNNEIAGFGSPFLVSPANGTVCFASAKLGFCFTAETFALKYSREYPSVDPAALSQQLWGQVALEKGRFVRITNFTQRPAFVTLVLEPLYKIVAHALTGKGHEALSSRLHPLPRDPVAAAREAIQLFCGDAASEGIDALLNVMPQPDARSEWLRLRYGLVCEAENSAIAIAPLLRSQKNGEENFAVVRVLHGVLQRNMKLVVVDEHSSDAEPFYTFVVKELLLKMLNGLVDVDCAYAGQVVLLTGFGTRPGSHLVLVGGAIAAPLLLEEEEDAADVGDATSGAWLDEARVYPLNCGDPMVHVGVELKDPTKSAELQRGLQILVRTTPGLDAHKEETGEFTLTGYGELHLDTTLHELRCGLCKGVKLGISQPFVSFSETVLEQNGVLAVSGPKRAQVGCTSGSLNRQLVDLVEYEQVDLFPRESSGVVKLWTTLRRHGMDALDSQHVMAAGPHATKGPSLLINDTIEEEQRQFAPLTQQRLQAMAVGFRSAVASGPLTGDVVRGVAVRLVFADVEAEVKDAAVISIARTTVKQALLGGQPRLLEPVLAVDITCPPECVGKLSEILQMRRGGILAEDPIAATTLVCVRALVPAMDSFGLETQVRMATQGEAFPLFSFDRWDLVPGDPFDATIHVPPLQPARGYQLARDFTLKTRFRKGLPPLLAEFQA
ncbi:small nuclear ribonucleoprotein component-like protein [Trypanosoma conorhini]|uniref:Small nuclear ribonucleoprotein component-like protein n=1 Tax=Trypanosoma conorhini TaxID=83891 RepID=A0A3R7LFD6_9TRYP|nr:small nuclear ribonucleoprotein component-like protein [Trypanosoma conorhini]RNF27303.1 small nuclear ribonucleoprotein component-like protein [Trypanosoma conorhini]